MNLIPDIFTKSYSPIKSHDSYVIAADADPKVLSINQNNPCDLKPKMLNIKPK